MFSAKLATFVLLTLATFASAAPAAADFKKQNALDAQALNAKFASLTANDACTGESPACRTLRLPSYSCRSSIA